MRARLFVPILGLEPDHEVIHELPEAKVFPITVHTAPKREWVGLTDEDMGFLFPYGKSEWVQETVKIIEAKLKEKNHV